MRAITVLLETGGAREQAVRALFAVTCFVGIDNLFNYCSTAMREKEDVIPNYFIITQTQINFARTTRAICHSPCINVNSNSEEIVGIAFVPGDAFEMRSNSAHVEERFRLNKCNLQPASHVGASGELPAPGAIVVAKPERFGRGERKTGIPLKFSDPSIAAMPDDPIFHVSIGKEAIAKVHKEH